MALPDLAGPWTGEAYRHIPAGSSYDILDFRFAGLTENRWNYRDQPTLYVASDLAVALAEMARHLDNIAGPGLEPVLRARELYRLTLKLERVLDLRSADVHAALSLAGAPHCFLEKEVARATAHYVRTVADAQAVLVPSMAFLDDPNRWVGVLFLEHLPGDAREFVTSVERERLFRLDP